eukprot:SAG31_NODE_12213_length_958_cov_1.288708_1_plen_171_part_10
MEGGLVFAVRPRWLLRQPDENPDHERHEGGLAKDGKPPPPSLQSSIARLCFNTEAETVVAKLSVHGALSLNAVDDNGWTALMWTAHWGEDEHVRALLDAGADTSLRTTKDWFNGALNYSPGMTALEIARTDLEQFDGGPEMENIVDMLETAAIGEWESGDEPSQASLQGTK